MEFCHCVFYFVEVVVFTTVVVEVGYSYQQSTREPYGCCFSSSGNDTEKTIVSRDCELEIGFHGPKCDRPCHYPSYGLLCHKICNCTTEQYCNHVTGCQVKNSKDGSSAVRDLHGT
nr:multiple epidermal growth factor-like domains protein 6 [Crassostrea gigas]